MLSWKQTFQILTLIVLVGTGLRLYGLGENSFVADEFLDINAAYGYHQTGEWRAWDFNFGAPSTSNENMLRDERATAYKWQVAMLFPFLPPTEAVARSISALWGIFAILVVFWSAWIFTRRQDMSLVAALFCALSVSAIIFSRRLRMYAMFFPLYLAAATAFYAAYERPYLGRFHALRSVSIRWGIHPLYLALGASLTLLSLSIHQLSVHLPLSVGVFLLIQAIFQYRETGSWKNKYGLSVMFGIAGMVLLTLLAPKSIQSFMNGLVFFDDHLGYLSHALTDFATPAIGIFLIGFGAWHLWQPETTRTAARYLLLAYVVPLLMAMFLWRRNVGPQYIFFIQSFGLILAAVGVVVAFETVKRMSMAVTTLRMLLVGLALILIIPNLNYFFEENNTYHETSTGGNPNYRKVFAYFKKEKTSGDVLITRNFRNYYWSGSQTPVYDFGGELSKEKLSMNDIVQILAEHPSGWFIYSGNDEDYIASEVEHYATKHWERVSNSNVRGDITVFRFGHVPESGQ